MGLTPELPLGWTLCFPDRCYKTTLEDPPLQRTLQAVDGESEAPASGWRTATHWTVNVRNKPRRSCDETNTSSSLTSTSASSSPIFDYIRKIPSNLATEDGSPPMLLESKQL